MMFYYLLVVALSGLFQLSPVVITSSTSTTSSQTSSVPSNTTTDNDITTTPTAAKVTTEWPPEVIDCFGKLKNNDGLQYCKTESKRKYFPDTNRTSTTSNSFSVTSNPEKTNHTIECYIIWDTLECLDHFACSLCTLNDSEAFDRSAQKKANASRETDGECYSIVDYKAGNRTRCSPSPKIDSSSTVTPMSTPSSTDMADMAAMALLIAIIAIVSIAIIAVIWTIAVMWWRHRTGSSGEAMGDHFLGGKPSRKISFSASTGYGPADFMSKRSSRRKVSPKGAGGMYRLSPLKNGKGGGKLQKQPSHKLNKQATKRQSLEKLQQKKKIVAGPSQLKAADTKVASKVGVKKSAKSSFKMNLMASSSRKVSQIKSQPSKAAASSAMSKASGAVSALSKGSSASPVKTSVSAEFSKTR